MSLAAAMHLMPSWPTGWRCASIRRTRGRAPGSCRQPQSSHRSNIPKERSTTRSTTVAEGLAVDPESVRLAALKATIGQAKLEREIVLSNYPTYRAAGLELQRAYKQLDATNALLLRNLRRFGNTLDANELVAAIKRSYELQLELAQEHEPADPLPPAGHFGRAGSASSRRPSAPARCCRYPES